MILKVFCIFDRKTDQFSNPMFLISEGQARRSFSDEVNRVDPANALNVHPGDFALYSLGSWDSDTGKFVCDAPLLVVLADQVVLSK